MGWHGGWQQWYTIPLSGTWIELWSLESSCQKRLKASPLPLAVISHSEGPCRRFQPIQSLLQLNMQTFHEQHIKKCVVNLSNWIYKKTETVFTPAARVSSNPNYSIHGYMHNRIRFIESSVSWNLTLIGQNTKWNRSNTRSIAIVSRSFQIISLSSVGCIINVLRSLWKGLIPSMISEALEWFMKESLQLLITFSRWWAPV